MGTGAPADCTRAERRGGDDAPPPERGAGPGRSGPGAERSAARGPARLGPHTHGAEWMGEPPDVLGAAAPLARISWEPSRLKKAAPALSRPAAALGGA